VIRLNRPIPAEKIRLLIFDLDGTLIDSRLDLAHSVNAMLRNFGRKELPTQVIASYVGDGAPTLVRRALGDPQDEDFLQQALQYFLAYYREHKLDNTYVYDGIREALAALRQSNDGQPRKFAILSNKPVNPSRQIVEALGLAEFFSQVYGGNSFATKKPDPLGAQTLLRENGCQAQETLLIGDSDIDVLTARNAGLWSCGVAYGFAPHTLESAPPDVLIDTPAEIARLFEPPLIAD
jgi:phosphoglycolate phosphatase